MASRSLGRSTYLDRSGSQPRSPALPLPGTSTECRTDRNGEPDSGERVILSRIGDRYDDADHESLAVPQPKWVADGDHVRTDGDAAAEGRRDHNLGELPRSERGDVDLRVDGGDRRGRLGAVGEPDRDAAAVGNDVMGGEHRAGAGDDHAGSE